MLDFFPDICWSCCVFFFLVSYSSSFLSIIFNNISMSSVDVINLKTWSNVIPCLAPPFLLSLVVLLLLLLLLLQLKQYSCFIYVPHKPTPNPYMHTQTHNSFSCKSKLFITSVERYRINDRLRFFDRFLPVDKDRQSENEWKQQFEGKKRGHKHLWTHFTHF